MLYIRHAGRIPRDKTKSYKLCYFICPKCQTEFVSDDIDKDMKIEKKYIFFEKYTIKCPSMLCGCTMDPRKQILFIEEYASEKSEKEV